MFAGKDTDHYRKSAAVYLRRLCQVEPNRRTGSAGNRQATDFFRQTISNWGYQLDAQPFDAIDFIDHGSTLGVNGETFQVSTSPYSLGCELEAGLLCVRTRQELEAADLRGLLLLMTGPLCAEQLTPKNFLFYNPDHHQELVAILEEKQPAAIITATGKNPEQAGALDPFPLFLDGDFNIASVYCSEAVGEKLIEEDGQRARLKISAQRKPAEACNVVASKESAAARKLTITAHIDAYEETPGAIDNASGVTVLLLVAEMLADYRGDYQLEVAALNGEDHYSAAGQLDYLNRYSDELDRLALLINVDGIGYRQGRSAYSVYGCSPSIEGRIDEAFADSNHFIRGEPWYAGDHMIFVQQGISALAFTSERMKTLMETIIHTERDTPELVEPARLVETAAGIAELIREL